MPLIKVLDLHSSRNRSENICGSVGILLNLIDLKMGINVEVENLILLLYAIPADAVIWVSEQGCIIKLAFFCIKNLEESSVSASIFVQVLFMFQRAHFAQPVPDYIVSLFMLLCVDKFNERNLFVFETCRRELRSFASAIKINDVNFGPPNNRGIFVMSTARFNSNLEEFSILVNKLKRMCDSNIFEGIHDRLSDILAILHSIYSVIDVSSNASCAEIETLEYILYDLNSLCTRSSIQQLEIINVILLIFLIYFEVIKRKDKIGKCDKMVESCIRNIKEENIFLSGISWKLLGRIVCKRGGICVFMDMTELLHHKSPCSSGFFLTLFCNFTEIFDQSLFNHPGIALFIIGFTSHLNFLQIVKVIQHMLHINADSCINLFSSISNQIGFNYVRLSTKLAVIFAQVLLRTSEESSKHDSIAIKVILENGLRAGWAEFGGIDVVYQTLSSQQNEDMYFCDLIKYLSELMRSRSNYIPLILEQDWIDLITKIEQNPFTEQKIRNDCENILDCLENFSIKDKTLNTFNGKQSDKTSLRRKHSNPETMGKPDRNMSITSRRSSRSTFVDIEIDLNEYLRRKKSTNLKKSYWFYVLIAIAIIFLVICVQRFVLGQKGTEPTFLPSTEFTPIPSMEPQQGQTLQPSLAQSNKPTIILSFSPTTKPSKDLPLNSGDLPTNDPTTAASSNPSSIPSAKPNPGPSSNPSNAPSTIPSTQPSLNPSRIPTATPSTDPSLKPSSVPSVIPSSSPSSSPSNVPSDLPSANPTSKPSSMPSTTPSVSPSSSPSSVPSMIPTMEPSSSPSSVPSMIPSTDPSSTPSGYPSILPTLKPSIKPTNAPSRSPTARPSEDPSLSPTTTPSMSMSFTPSLEPSFVPTKSRGTLIRERILSEGVNLEDLDDPMSPQSKAYSFIVDYDGMELDHDAPSLVQRYSLATIYYSTNGDSWIDSSDWLTHVHECNWFGINLCSETNVVQEIYLCKLFSMTPQTISIIIV